MKIQDLFGIAQRRRIKLLKRETEETKKLCLAQKLLNELRREEKELDNAN